MAPPYPSLAALKASLDYFLSARAVLVEKKSRRESLEDQAATTTIIRQTWLQTDQCPSLIFQLIDPDQVQLLAFLLRLSSYWILYSSFRLFNSVRWPEAAAHGPVACSEV